MKNPIQIIISGGCVQDVINDSGHPIIIKDYDVEGVDAICDPRCKQDEDGEWYQEMLF